VIRRDLEITLIQRRSSARHAGLTIDARTVPISAGWGGNVIPVDLRPGTTKIKISVDTPRVRCPSAPLASLPSVSATLRPADPA
jgi:hypothetical protein